MMSKGFIAFWFSMLILGVLMTFAGIGAAEKIVTGGGMLLAAGSGFFSFMRFCPAHE